MKILGQTSRSSMLVFLSALLAIALAVIHVPRTEFYREWFFEGKAKVREGQISQAALNIPAFQPGKVMAAVPTGFTPANPSRLPRGQRMGTCHCF